ncbi:conjugal transfer protein TrbI [Calothrix sp. 336/3]|uniref:conjugal transfer protein TrbI n=1 Tax=Calothrix sp. 336/3 TaxID=1337936 RepID=UPI0004E2DCEE|nr:conjugal transfer protein TrbI [Calothrix sp. 336/3]AKG23890.1 bacterial conjugation TrbI-like protein [Calothrix sp. 336/3]
MAHLARWKSSALAVMAMTMTTTTVAPLVAFAPAQAQMFNSQLRGITIAAGARLPVTFEKEKIVIAPQDKSEVTLKVARNIRDRSGTLLIPAETEIFGSLQPATRNGKRGTQFIAEKMVFPNGDEQPINAKSQILTKTEKLKKGASTNSILTGAAVGAGTASLISLITGNKKIETLEPVVGAAVGALGGLLFGKKEVEVVVIKPEEDLTLTLTNDLVLARR